MQAFFNAKNHFTDRTLLPAEVVEEVTDLLETMPEENPFATLKTTIIQ